MGNPYYPIDDRHSHVVASETANLKDEFTTMRISIAETLGNSEGFGWNDKWKITRAIEALIDAKLEAFADRVEAATGVRP